MRKSVIAIIVIVLVVLYMSIFVVKEGERGITLRFGKVLRDDENKPLVYAPGLHFKIPFIESVKMLDARIQTMDNQADRFVTKEKKDLIVDSTSSGASATLAVTTWQPAAVTSPRPRCC
jgi:membrane protease subunit HflC